MNSMGLLIACMVFLSVLSLSVAFVKIASIKYGASSRLKTVEEALEQEKQKRLEIEAILTKFKKEDLHSRIRTLENQTGASRIF